MRDGAFTVTPVAPKRALYEMSGVPGRARVRSYEMVVWFISVQASECAQPMGLQPHLVGVT